MRHIITSAVAAGAALCVASPAAAQEKCFDKGTLSYIDCPQPAPAPPPPAPVVYTPPPPAWTGWYLGAHAGHAWSDFDGSYVDVEFDDLDVDGFLVGGQLGYNHQFENNWVLGAEIDASAVFADDGVTVGGPAVTTQTFPRRIEAELDWLASARLRLGYASDKWMPYVTGGVALAGWSADGSYPGGAFSVDETSFGGVAGAGVEHMFDPNWVIGVEGLYYFFDDDEDISAAGFAGDSVSLDNVIVGRLRLNYKF